MIDYEKLLPIFADISAAKMALKDSTDKLIDLICENSGLNIDFVKKIINEMNTDKGIK